MRLLKNAAYEQARAGIAGTKLKLRTHRNGNEFAITERLAPLGSSMAWYQEGEFAIIAIRTGSEWFLWHYDGDRWGRRVIPERLIGVTVAEMVGL